MSMFTSHSGKTNNSAPINDHGESASSMDSPSYFQKKHLLKETDVDIKLRKVKKRGKLLSRNKLMKPSGTVSPSKQNNLFKDVAAPEAQQQFSSTQTSIFKMVKDNAAKSEDPNRSESATSFNTKKMFPIKLIKFPIKKNPNYFQKKASLGSSITSGFGNLPKPPLSKQKASYDLEAPGSTEALLRMADEGLANIELELRQTKPQVNFANNQTSTLEKIRLLSQTRPDSSKTN